MDDNRFVQRSSEIHGLSMQSPSMALLGVLGRFGKRVCAGPGGLEAASQEMVSDLRSPLDLGCVELRAEISERRRILVSEGIMEDEFAVEVPVLRDGKQVGALSASPLEPGGTLSEEQLHGLQTAAALCSLAVDAAHAREVAALRTAQGTLVQLASEALGSITDEKQLHKTVLVLTLELLESSGAAILFEDGWVVDAGKDGRILRRFEQVKLTGRKPWIGRIGKHLVLGVPVGEDGGSLFVVREERPYTEEEGISLKLVARQFARARERSRLHASLEKTTLDVISALAAALESRDGTTGEHIRRTQDLAAEVAVALGLDPEQVKTAQYASILHDVGKIGVPDAILNKPGPLDEQEWVLMRRHPGIGADIVSRVASFKEVAEAILTHHERYDGRGYPAGIMGKDIPIEARIVSVIDAYDAITNDRPYRKAGSHKEAVRELERGSGSQFDPEVVKALKSVLSNREEKE